MKISRGQANKFFLFLILIILLIILIYLIASRLTATAKISSPAASNSPKLTTRLSPPEKLAGIYLTGYTFSNDRRRQELIDLIDTTELNAMVIDIKDPNGKLMFWPTADILKPLAISPQVIDNKKYQQILTDLKTKNIYTIARVTTFEDNASVKAWPSLALKNKDGTAWRNWGGVGWLDMTNPDVWPIPATEAREAFRLGFDEVQFDYIRFPSDGDIKQIEYFQSLGDQKKYQRLAEFFKFLKNDLADIDAPLSIDVFGLTTKVREDKEYDLNIGQRLADAALYFDYISPMVYPSHYPKNYMGFANPADHPYEIVKDAMKDGQLILQQTTSSRAQLRPWLQDFNLGAIYDAKKVKDQIKAAEENNVSGWLLWNPRNIYTAAALENN